MGLPPGFCGEMLRAVYELLTEEATKALHLAANEAKVRGDDHLGDEHLLVGLLRSRSGIAAMALTSLGLTADLARDCLLRLVPPAEWADAPRTSWSAQFTPRAKRALEEAGREAFDAGSRAIGTGHILLGITHDDDGVAASILFELDIEAEAIRAAVARLLPPL